MHALKAFIFDLDGTLIDSLADLAEAVNRMLDGRGYPRQPLGVFPKYVGDGVRALVERALPADVLAAEDIPARVEEYQQHYQNTWKTQTHPYVGIEEALQALHHRGMKLAVLSNKPHAFTQLCCDHFFPSIPFAAVLGARADVPRKPDPAGGLEICEKLGLTPADCAYVGDSDIDMQFAKNTGMLAVGVKWGFRGEQELRASGAAEIVTTPDDIVCLVSGVC